MGELWRVREEKIKFGGWVAATYERLGSGAFRLVEGGGASVADLGPNWLDRQIADGYVERVPNHEHVSQQKLALRRLLVEEGIAPKECLEGVWEATPAPAPTEPTARDLSELASAVVAMIKRDQGSREAEVKLSFVGGSWSCQLHSSAPDCFLTNDVGATAWEALAQAAATRLRNSRGSTPEMREVERLLAQYQ